MVKQAYQALSALRVRRRAPRLTVRLVTTDAERRACLRVLEAVRGEELGRDVLSGRQVPLCDDPNGFLDALYLCEVGGRVVGTVRATSAVAVQSDPTLAPDFRFDLDALGALAPRAFLAHRMALLPEFRRSGAALAMMSRLYRDALRRGILFCLIDCEPPLVRLYRQLGFVTVGDPYTAHGNVFVAMVLANHDVGALVSARSPLLLDWARAGFPRDDAGRVWLAAHRRRCPSPGFAATSEAADRVPFLACLSTDSRRAALRNATQVRLAPRQELFRQGDRARWVAAVLDGSVLCRRDGRVVGVRTAGEALGECAWLERLPRQCSAQAGEGGATVMVLSPSALDRVTDPTDRAVLEQLLRCQPSVHPVELITPLEAS